MRRVVVTGMGMLAPFGRGVDYNWENIVAGKSAIRRIDEDLELYDVPVKIAGKVPMGKEAHRFDPDTVMEPKEQRRVDKFILFGMAAGIDAMEDCGWKPESEEEQYRAGVMMGSGIGGLQTIYENSVIINENKSTHRVSPFFIPSCLINMISGNLSIRFGLKGPNHACVTACFEQILGSTGAVHIYIVEMSDVVDCLGGDGGRIDMAVCVDNFHIFHLIFGW